MGQRIFNQTSQDMLRMLPGMNEKAVGTLMRELYSISELANMEEVHLCGVIGTELGRRVYRFFNRSVYEDVTMPNFRD